MARRICPEALWQCLEICLRLPGSSVRAGSRGRGPSDYRTSPGSTCPVQDWAPPSSLFPLGFENIAIKNLLPFLDAKEASGLLLPSSLP